MVSLLRTLTCLCRKGNVVSNTIDTTHCLMASLAISSSYCSRHCSVLAFRTMLESISSPSRPKGLLHPDRGRPTNQWLVGPCRIVLYKGGGGQGAVHEIHRAATPHLQTLTDLGSTRAAGSYTAAAVVDPRLPMSVPPPGAPSPYRAGDATASPASSRGRPCDHDQRHGHRPRQHH
jgi:hypothetical protein